MRRLIVVVTAAALSLGAVACDKKTNEGGADPLPDPTPTTLATMSAEDFHQIGVRAFAFILPGYRTPAQVLGVYPDDVISYEQALCDGSYAALPGTRIYPSQVPAFEAIFTDLARSCPSASYRLSAERARVAGVMNDNEGERIASLFQTNTSPFCESFHENEPITSFVLKAAMTKLHVDEEGVMLAELGVKLLDAKCPQFTHQLDFSR